MEPLVDPTDLEGLPGAPFPPALVASASTDVRGEADWHIAPQVTETVEIYTGRSAIAVLPSLMVVAVTEVREATNDGAVIEGWRLRPDTPLLVRDGRRAWPEYITVDLTHGYEQCPADLLPILASRAQQIRTGGRVRRQVAGSFSVDYETGSGINGSDAALARYRLTARP